MFFLLRSAVCIGLVIAALPDATATGGHGLGDLAGDLGGAGSAAIGRYCRANPAHCLSIAESAAGLAPGSDRPAPRKPHAQPAVTRS